MPEAVAETVMRAEVVEGLGRDQKELPPKFFYDRRGSELFEAITRLPEYYLTRAEEAILEAEIAPLVRVMAPTRLVELGAGSGRKTRILLEAMIEARGAAIGVEYVPVDVSREFLEDSAEKTRNRFPGIAVRPHVADLSRPGFLRVRVAAGAPGGAAAATPGAPDRHHGRASLFAFLGSTLGNFRKEAAGALLREVADALGPDDAFLLGVDLVPGPGKPVERLEAAYDDSRGITAEFNLNVLRVLNRTLGADFDLPSFRHAARYVPEKSRIEMHLVARKPQAVTFSAADDVVVHFAEGESVRTEISCKYDLEGVTDLLGGVGMVLDRWHPGDDGLYAMALARRG